MKFGLLVLALGVPACDSGSGRDVAARAATLVAPAPASSDRVAAPVIAASAPNVTPSPPVPVGALGEITWHYDHGPFGASDVVVSVPADAAKTERFPVLVAFHGRGESLKGPKYGPRGWLDDYQLGATVRRLKAPPLVSEDFLGFVTDERLALFNANLAAHAYRGLIVICPFLPDILKGSRAFEEGKRLSAFVVDELVARAHRELPALNSPASTGVDGVSLGGRASLLVGLLRPEAFGAVGALQPAIDSEEAPRFAEMAEAAREKNPALHLRLLTSDGDYFLDATHALDKALSERHVEHRLDVVVGPHSYDFNRGPGGYEMLTFHDVALR